MRTRTLHGETVGGVVLSVSVGTRRPVKRSLESPEIESRSLDRVLAKSERLLSERVYSNDVGRCHNHGNYVQSARGVGKRLDVTVITCNLKRAALVLH